MTTDRQLQDLKRFCCNELEYQPFTVDPTFNIGRFNITPITLITGKRTGWKESLYDWTSILHEKKTTETYSTFSGVLRTLEPELRNVMAFGTDNERALVDGFKNNYDRSVHLLCEIHLKKISKQNCKILELSGRLSTLSLRICLARQLEQFVKVA